MIYSFLYVLVFSIALVLIQKLDFNINPLFSLMITASIATLYFNLINYNYLKKIYSDCIRNTRQWLTVMFIVLVMWATTMIGPGKIGASLFNFIYFAWLGVLGLLSLCLQNWRANTTKLYFALSLFTLMVLNIAFELEASYTWDIGYGILLAIIGGTSSFIYFKRSQALAQNAHLSATQVLAVRFYLAIFILFLFLPKHEMVQYINISNSINLILLAFFSLIIPLYFSQKALESLSSEQHAIINSLCPIVTAVLQEFIFHDLKWKQVLVFGLYSFVVLSLHLVERFNKKIQPKLIV